MQKRALIVGISGVIGSALAEKLQREGWQVSGLSRGRGAVPQGCRSLTADLTDADAVRAALSQEQPDALFFSVWSRQENEKENVRVNGGMVRNVIDALGERLSGAHVALVTGLLISILQAATQINEMTLSFIPKIVAVFVAMVVAGPWMLNLLLDYVRTLFSNLPYIIG